MSQYTKQQLEDAKTVLESTLRKCEKKGKAQPKFYADTAKIQFNGTHKQKKLET
jgi:hypothetical protein